MQPEIGDMQGTIDTTGETPPSFMNTTLDIGDPSTSVLQTPVEKFLNVPHDVTLFIYFLSIFGSSQMLIPNPFLPKQNASTTTILKKSLFGLLRVEIGHYGLFYCPSSMVLPPWGCSQLPRYIF